MICLINPPFGAIEHPSLALGLLQASAERAGFSCRSRYANLAFAERLGPDLYFWLANTASFRNLLGEWVFGGLLSPEGGAPAEEYLQRFLDESLENDFRVMMPGHDLRETVRQARKMAAEFIEGLAREVVAAHPRIVGCTSTFQQNCAALALLKRIRQLDDTVVTLLGGANCEGTMAYGQRRAFPWVDFVVSGEAEMIFPDLVRLLLQHGRAVDEELLPECVVGASRAAAATPGPETRAVVRDLDATPLPEYGDYFTQLARSPLAREVLPGLLLETSRGCWRAAHRCKFCGLNGLGLKYRTKSADRVLEEIGSSCTRYGTRRVMFADNNLSPALARKVLPRLAESPEPPSIFFETSVMSRDQMELMARAGARWLQVGVESLHPRLLALMGKGTTVLQNLQVLRWAYELGVRVGYNLMYGFPGEWDEWYGEMSELLPLLHHLEPPRAVNPMRYVRFSVYQEEPERFGLRLAPREAFACVYGLPPGLLANIAYTFEDENGSQRHIGKGPGFKALEEQWRQWYRVFWPQDSGRQPAFLYVLSSPGDPQKILYDTRACAMETAVILTDLEARILEYCDDIRTLPQIEEHCAPERGDAAAVSQALENLLRRQALFRQDGSYLSLAALPPRQVYAPIQDFPGGYYRPGVQHPQPSSQEEAEYGLSG